MDIREKFTSVDIDIDNGMVIDANTGEDIVAIDEMSLDMAKDFISLLISERDELKDEMLECEYKVEMLENDIEMFRDNL